jgi:hypothetical protein
MQEKIPVFLISILFITKLLRDYWGHNSFVTGMLENSIPLSRNTSFGANVFLQVVEPGFYNVPLHHIKLKSDFVSGQVVVGVRPTLPVEGIYVVIENLVLPAEATHLH